MRVEYTFLRGWAKNPWFSRRKRRLEIDGEVDLVSPVLLQEAAEWPRAAHPGPLTRRLSGRPPGSTRPHA